MARGEKRNPRVGGCVLRLHLAREGAVNVRLDGDRGKLSPADRERLAWLAWTHTGAFTQDAWYEALFGAGEMNGACGGVDTAGPSEP